MYRAAAAQLRTTANASHYPPDVAVAESMEAHVRECDRRLPSLMKARQEWDVKQAALKAAQAVNAEESWRQADAWRQREEHERNMAHEMVAKIARISAEEDRIRKVPAEMRIALSASLCISAAARAETLASIAEEKRMSHRVGVTNLSTLESL